MESNLSRLVSGSTIWCAVLGVEHIPHLLECRGVIHTCLPAIGVCTWWEKGRFSIVGGELFVVVIAGDYPNWYG